jgi:hypothetical protein
VLSAFGRGDARLSQHLLAENVHGQSVDVRIGNLYSGLRET